MKREKDAIHECENESERQSECEGECQCSVSASLCVIENLLYFARVHERAYTGITLIGSAIVCFNR